MTTEQRKYTDPRPSPICPSWPGCRRGQRATRPPRPQKPLLQSRGEDSWSPAQGHLLSGEETSPTARPGTPSRVSRARPPLCSPSARRPLAGLGKDPGPDEAAGPGRDPQPRQGGRSGLLRAGRRDDSQACLSVSRASRASVSLAAAASPATTSAAYFRQLFLSSSTPPSPRMRPAPTASDWALPSAPPLRNQSGQK